jgi:signal transduction histidine kinase
VSLEPSQGRSREHLLFGGTLLCLVLLASWWFTFMVGSVQLEHEHAFVEIRLEATELAHELESAELDHPDLHVVARDEASPLAVPLASQPDLVVDVRMDRIDELNSTLSRRRVMVLGEGGFLLGLLGVCIIMLLRLVTTRSAVQQEMELFVGQMTHEMKTPLSGLRALLETLQKGRLEGEPLQEALALGIRQVEREEHLVQTLLHAQRLRVLPESVAAEPVDLGELVRGFVEHRQVAWPGEPERYRVEESGPMNGLADRDAVWTILENLFDNADKYGATRIQVELGLVSGRVQIRCTDDGQGFELSRKAILFEPFNAERGAGSEYKHGTGLGLYISRRLARSMGGELRGESPGLDQGASFVLELPAVAA